MLGTGKVGETLMTNAPTNVFRMNFRFISASFICLVKLFSGPVGPTIPMSLLKCRPHSAAQLNFRGPRLSRSINVSQVPGPGSGSIRVLKLHLEASQLYLLPAGWMRISGPGMRICWLAVATMKYSWRDGGVRIYGYFAHQTQFCSRFPLALFSGVFPWIRPG